jgi:hypothetical protein
MACPYQFRRERPIFASDDDGNKQKDLTQRMMKKINSLFFCQNAALPGFWRFRARGDRCCDFLKIFKNLRFLIKYCSV